MTTYHFQPEAYFSTMGPHAPVLRINPGDRVITNTIDAWGMDKTGTKVISTGNPMTGPFFINGAEPGDTLVVRLEQITPDREEGWSGCRLSPNVVDPGFIAELGIPPKDQPWEIASWKLDTATWTARLLTPQTQWESLRLPLEPMLGCFGVAPQREQSIITATSAEHGGNMDYRGFCAGATAYFPVFVPGALFFLGDGHAVQGDGEIAGTGIEVSMEVSFSVDLLKNQPINWPRGENATHIFTVGNARPLDQALQHATSEMMRWLTSSYGMDALSAGLLLGQTVEYDLGNIYDPAYTMVCKLAKKYLLNS